MQRNTFVKNGVVTLLVLLLNLAFYGACFADMTDKDFLAEARKTTKEITVAVAKADIDAGKAVVLDCRTEDEYKKGHVPGAVHLQRGLLEFKADKKFPDKDAYIIVYCKTGGRSLLSADTLNKMGYKNAVSMDGGWKGWVKEGGAVE